MQTKIRVAAHLGDWLVGFGSKNVNGFDYSGRVVYAMKVTRSMSFSQYDSYCREKRKGKIPDVYHNDFRRRVGDCIFDYGRDSEGKLRPSVHTLKNRVKDLCGKNVLLSEHFYYFGDRAVKLPMQLRDLIIQRQGHRSTMNGPWRNQFVDWIERNFKANVLYGKPQVSDSASVQKSMKERRSLKES